MHTPACTSQCWSRQTPHGLRVCIWMHLVNGTGNSPSPGQPTPGVVKQDKSSGGSVDTTKTRSGPQRVRMSKGERPIGTAKGKQPNTEALCQPPHGAEFLEAPKVLKNISQRPLASHPLQPPSPCLGGMGGSDIHGFIQGPACNAPALCGGHWPFLDEEGGSKGVLWRTLPNSRASSSSPILNTSYAAPCWFLGDTCTARVGLFRRPLSPHTHAKSPRYIPCACCAPTACLQCARCARHAPSTPAHYVLRTDAVSALHLRLAAATRWN